MGIESGPKFPGGDFSSPENESFESEKRSFLTGLRNTAEQNEDFEGSLGDEALKVMEDYLSLQETLKERHPGYQAPIANSLGNSLNAEVPRYKRLSLEVGTQYRLTANAEGRLSVEGPLHGGDSALLYNADHPQTVNGWLLGLDVDLPSGRIQGEVSPRDTERLKKIFQTSREYYRKFQSAALGSREIAKWAPLYTETHAEINRLRREKLAET